MFLAFAAKIGAGSVTGMAPHTTWDICQLKSEKVQINCEQWWLAPSPRICLAAFILSSSQLLRENKLNEAKANKDDLNPNMKAIDIKYL